MFPRAGSSLSCIVSRISFWAQVTSLLVVVLTTLIDKSLRASREWSQAGNNSRRLANFLWRGPVEFHFRRQETFAYLQIPCSEIYGTLMVQPLYNLYSTRIELVIELVGSNGPNDRTCKIQKGKESVAFPFSRVV